MVEGKKPVISERYVMPFTSRLKNFLDPFKPLPEKFTFKCEAEFGFGLYPRRSLRCSGSSEVYYENFVEK